MRGTYQPEVDGLRALAIVPVVLYHAWLPGLPGGFLGVDVFFAISGYLIVGYLQAESANHERIDWSDFYARRLRRLLPMSLFTLLASTLLAVWLLPPTGPLQAFSRSAVASALFVANLHFAQLGSDYFGETMQQVPLLHLWSLGVEEQFYLAVPLLFLLAAAWRAKHASSRLLLLGTLVSLALCIAGSANDDWSSLAFFSPLTRAWEFGVGGLVAIAPWAGARVARRLAALLTTGALAVLIALILLVTRYSPASPLVFGLAAVAAAVLLWGIRQRQGQAPALGWLRWRALVWIGQRSYSWYLLHWPALVFYRRYRLEDVSVGELLLVAALTLLLAALTHRWIETPLRRASWLGQRSPWPTFALSAATVFAFGLLVLVVRLHARDARLGPEYRHLLAATAEVQSWQPYLMPPAARPAGGVLPEVAADGARETLVIWGDSHANSLYVAVRDAGARLGMNVVSATLSSCPPLLDRWAVPPAVVTPAVRRSLQHCAGFNREVLDNLVARARREPVTVVLAARWVVLAGTAPITAKDRHEHRQGAAQSAVQQRLLAAETLRSVQFLQAAGMRVILVATVPGQLLEAPECEWRHGLAACRVARQRVEAAHAGSLAMLQEIAARTGAPLLDPTDAYCDAEHCPAGEAGALWYTDGDHLSAAGAARLVPALTALLQAPDCPDGPPGTRSCTRSTQRTAGVATGPLTPH